MLETWKPVPGYEGIYSVSNLGRVKSHSRVSWIGNKRTVRRVEPERILGPCLSGPGTRYLKANLSRDGKRKIVPVHRLVALCFVPNPHGKPNVLHNDGDPTNNAASNLRWGDQSENMADRLKHTPTTKKWKRATPEVMAIAVNREITLNEASALTGYHQTTISRWRNQPSPN